MTSRTDRGWERLFAGLGLEAELQERGWVQVTAGQIRRLTGREPRLMTKFDTREYRPDTLKRAECTVLPLRNGEYVLVRGDGYAHLPTARQLETVPAAERRRLETLPEICRSESQVIDTALASGILERFTGDSGLVLTIRGRLRALPFSFTFDGPGPVNLDVDGVQVEVDAGYEGERVYLLEAKMGARDNLIIRQLYYPCRMWEAAGVRKLIVPLVLTYSNRIFTVSEFRFTDLGRYHSLEHVRSASYVLGDAEGLPSLADLLQTTPPSAEPPGIPFPQANDLRRVIDVIDAVADGLGARQALTDHYEFAARQASYYAEAARYLGFLQRGRGGYGITGAGEALTAAAFAARQTALARAILRMPVFRQAAEEMAAGAGPPDRERLEAIIAAHRPELSGATRERRAGAAAQWLDWLRHMFQDGLWVRQQSGPSS